jgi:hypothetical protein
VEPADYGVCPAHGDCADYGIGDCQGDKAECAERERLLEPTHEEVVAEARRRAQECAERIYPGGTRWRSVEIDGCIKLGRIGERYPDHSWTLADVRADMMAERGRNA